MKGEFNFCLATVGMSVVDLFVVAVQWSISTILTSPFILHVFLNTCPLRWLPTVLTISTPEEG